MRVQGNSAPASVTVEIYLPVPGTVEIRLRENIKEVSVTDGVTEQAVTMYEYDEYVFLLKDREGLQEDIEANLADWLATGRTMEVDENASILRAARYENSSLLYEMAALVDDVYNSDMEMMGL